MKNPSLIIVIYLMISPLLTAQQINSVSGIVVEDMTGNPLPKIKVRAVKSSQTTFTDGDGIFKISNLPKGENILEFVAEDYLTKRIPVVIDSLSADIDLGLIRLTEKTSLQEEHYIFISEDELYSDTV